MDAPLTQVVHLLDVLVKHIAAMQGPRVKAFRCEGAKRLQNMQMSFAGRASRIPRCFGFGSELKLAVLSPAFHSRPAKA